MELDKRIDKNKTYIDCFETELAKKFIGKECYLSNDVTLFKNVDSLYKAVLKEVDEEAISPYMLENTRWRHSSNFILPCEWVKSEEPEKKYRPYTLAEWVDQHEIGEVIHYRDKDYKQQFHVMYSGYIIDEGEDIQDIRTIGRIVFMFTAYFLEELFKDYEICINGEWRPFGIKEK